MKPRRDDKQLPDSFRKMIEEWEANRKAENRAFWRNRLKWGVTTVLVYTLLIPWRWAVASLFKGS